ncbi:MAG: DUF4145 domain-containing protein [Anaerolineaceae bacterium]|nr:DUF4145 domain-containing protein [Anaerolineaceae bacterium]
MFRPENTPIRKGPRGEILPVENEGAPDTFHPSGLCPRCGKQSSFEIVGSLPVTLDYGSIGIRPDGKEIYDYIDQATALICRHCKQGVIVIEEQWIGDHPRKEGLFGGTVTYRGIHWWPLPGANLSQDIPINIASAFEEAILCLSANCPRASAVMARRTLEAIAFDKGETRDDQVLQKKIDNLVTKNLLPPALSDYAKEVRLVGNIGGHFDPINEVTTKDAQQLMIFVRELLKYLYEMPADLARRRLQP